MLNKQTLVLLIVLLSGCAKLDTGQVTSKRYHPPEPYTYVCGCAMRSDDGITCLIDVECEGVHPEEWVVWVDGYTRNEKPITVPIEVSKSIFDKCEPGTLVYRDDNDVLRFEYGEPQ